MNKKIIKKIVSVLVCASMIAGVASISNATSINSGSSSNLGVYQATAGTNHYSYTVDYIHYDGLAVGAFIQSGLTVRFKYPTTGTTIEQNTVCTVNTSSGSGTYYTGYSGGHTFRLHNNTGKHVSITFNFSSWY